MSSEGDSTREISSEKSKSVVENEKNKISEDAHDSKKPKLDGEFDKKEEEDEETKSKASNEKIEEKENDNSLKMEDTEDDQKEKENDVKDDKKDDTEGDEVSEKEDDEKKEDKSLDKQSNSREKKKAQKSTEDTSVDGKDIKADIPSGKGVQLGEIPRIDASISRFKNDDLKLLHRLLFKVVGKTTLIKKNIKKFNGFDFTKDSDEYTKKVEFTKKFELKQLKVICEMLDLEKKGSKDEIVERIVDFLLEPKDSGKAAGGGRPRRTAAVRANNRGYSSLDDSYSSDEQRASRTTRGKGKRTNLKDDSTSVSDFILSDSSDEKPKAGKRKRGRKKLVLSDEEDISDVDESATSEDSDVEPKQRKKSKRVSNNKTKAKATPNKRGRKPAADSEKKTPAKRGRKPARDTSEDSEQDEEDEEENGSSSEDEPLIKKAKSPQPPTDEDIKKYVKEILDGANLEEITMKTVCKQVYAHYPDFDLAHKKDFIKSTVKSLIST